MNIYLKEQYNLNLYLLQEIFKLTVLSLYAFCYRDCLFLRVSHIVYDKRLHGQHLFSTIHNLLY